MSLSSTSGAGVVPGVHSSGFSETTGQELEGRSVESLGAGEGIPAALDAIANNSTIEGLFAKFDEIHVRLISAVKKMFNCVIVLTICNIALAIFSIVLLVI